MERDASNGSLVITNDSAVTIEDIELQPMNKKGSVVPSTIVTTPALPPPPDCFPRWIAKYFSCFAICIPRRIQRHWTYLRSRAHQLVEHRFFEWLIIASILTSSATLVSRLLTTDGIYFHRISNIHFKALEDINTRQQPVFHAILIVLDKVFTVIFTMELILKWFAYGIRKYFTNGWNWLDFVIVVVSVLGSVLDWMGVADIPAFKSMRTLRALRPLKALSRFEGMRVRREICIAALHQIQCL